MIPLTASEQLQLANEEIAALREQVYALECGQLAGVDMDELRQTEEAIDDVLVGLTPAELINKLMSYLSGED